MEATEHGEMGDFTTITVPRPRDQMPRTITEQDIKSVPSCISRSVGGDAMSSNIHHIDIMFPNVFLCIFKSAVHVMVHVIVKREWPFIFYFIVTQKHKF